MSREPENWPWYLPPRRSYSHGTECVGSVSPSAGRMPIMGPPAPKAETPERFKVEKLRKILEVQQVGRTDLRIRYI